MERPLLQPLPDTIFEMRYYADLKVGSNNFVELRHDKVTHFYSAPYVHIGRMTRVIFTRSWVKIYVDNNLVYHNYIIIPTFSMDSRHKVSA